MPEVVVGVGFDPKTVLFTGKNRDEPDIEESC